MPPRASSSEWRNKRKISFEKRGVDNPRYHSGPSSCFRWSSIEEKYRHSAPAEAMAPFSACRSPKETISATEYWRRRRSAVHCALSSSTFTERRSEPRRAISVWFPSSSFPIDTPCFQNVRSRVCRSGAFLPGRSSLGEGCNWIRRLRQDSACGDYSLLVGWIVHC